MPVCAAVETPGARLVMADTHAAQVSCWSRLSSRCIACMFSRTKMHRLPFPCCLHPPEALSTAAGQLGSLHRPLSLGHASINLGFKSGHQPDQAFLPLHLTTFLSTAPHRGLFTVFYEYCAASKAQGSWDLSYSCLYFLPGV